MRGLLRLGLIIFVLFLLAALAGGGYFVSTLFPAGSSAQAKLILIRGGTSLSSVAEQLKKEHLVKNEYAFVLYARLLRWQNQLKSGYYQVSPNMSAASILKKMVTGQSETVSYTIPEGYTIAQASQGLEKYDMSPQKYEHLATAENDKWQKSFSFLPPHTATLGLEGYLFPDTYYLTGSEQDLIEVQLKRFKEVVGPLWQSRKPTYPLSLADTITLASIVDLEGTLNRELPIIAAVFLKRLQIGMKLGADPTVEYVLKRRQGPQGLSLKDVQVDSPYNTYRYKGLPPAPIGNPGRSAIQAVLNPVATPYLYFVAKGDGSHIFSQTYSEHLAAIERIRSKG